MTHPECLNEITYCTVHWETRLGKEKPTMHRVGIDWADEKHDVCILAPDGRILSEFEITHDWQGFQKLKATLAPLAPFQVNIERPNGLLVDWMVGLGWHVYVTPPRIVAHRRPRRSNTSSHNDPHLQ
jgi:hypothetical protein